MCASIIEMTSLSSCQRMELIKLAQLLIQANTMTPRLRWSINHSSQSIAAQRSNTAHVTASHCDAVTFLMTSTTRAHLTISRRLQNFVSCEICAPMFLLASIVRTCDWSSEKNLDKISTWTRVVRTCGWLVCTLRPRD